MNAGEIRAMMVNDGPHNKFRPESITEQIAVAQLEMSNEIAAQLAESNQIARLRLAIEYQQADARMPANLCADIDAATKGESK